MKKLLALLALAGFTSAFAQSGVTLYGNLDQTLYHAKNGGQAVGATNSNGGSTSLWGLTGKEDLGNGMSAQFDLKSEVTLATGQASSTTTGVNTAAGTNDNNNANTGFFNRGAWVGLNSNYGSVKIGRQNDAMWEQEGKYNNTGINSFGWNNLTAAATAFGTTASSFNGKTLTGSVFGTSTTSTYNPSAQGSSIPFWAGVSYETPSFNGVKAKVMTSPTTSYSKGSGESKRTAASISYDNGPLSLSYGESMFNGTDSSEAARVSMVGAAYTYKNFKFTAAQQKTDYKGSWAALANDLTVNAVGVGYTQGKMEYNVGYTVLKDDADSSYKTTQTGVTARYNFTKRTSVYGGYGHGKNEGTSNKTGIVYAGAALGTANTTNSALLFGLRHQF